LNFLYISVDRMDSMIKWWRWSAQSLKERTE
jgi:hypothetical protein